VAKVRQRSPGADEGLLDGVLRVGAGAEYAQRYAVNACLVTAHQFLERVDVASLGSSYEDRVIELTIHGLLSDMLRGASGPALARLRPASGTTAADA
jgi:hypothetical protein